MIEKKMPLERAAAPPDLIQADGNVGEGWYEVSYIVELVTAIASI